ncbi:inositol polyphosphate multikinase [Ciona intestinalis]
MSKVLLQPRTVEKKRTLEDAEKNEKEEVLEGTGCTNPPLPRGCRPLAHQVAGHRYGQGRLGIGMLQHMDGSILKPVQPPPRGKREVAFYQKIFDAECDDPVLLTLQPFLPKLLGVWTPPSSSLGEVNSAVPTYSYMKLEDACRRFRNPSILDIKIGRVSYDPEANQEKRAIESAKYPPLYDLGFQLLGMRVSGPSPNEAIFYDKKYGRSLSKDRITEGLDLFLSGNVPWKKYIVKAFIQRLEMILSWFESQKRYQFYSSSLLLIYEGEFFDGSSDSDEEFIHKYRQMKLSPPSSYLATVRRFLNRNKEEERTKPGIDGANIVLSTSSTLDKKEVDQVLVPDVSTTTPTPTEHDLPSENNDTGSRESRGVALSSSTTGRESGYSSEVESKNRRQSAAIRNEFVASLSRRVEESTRDLKYRFPPEIVDVRMIDFAHVFEEPRSDVDYIYGLRNLIAYFRKVLKQL